MSTNIAQNHCRGFQALTGRETGNFRPFARDVDLERRIGHTLSPSRVPLLLLIGVPPDPAAAASLRATSDPLPS